MTDHEVLAAAFATKAELPMVERAVALLKMKLADDWAKCGDPVERERLWHRRAVLDDIVQMMVAAAAEVDLAEHRATLATEGFQP